MCRRSLLEEHEFAWNHAGNRMSISGSRLFSWSILLACLLAGSSGQLCYAQDPIEGEGDAEVATESESSEVPEHVSVSDVTSDDSIQSRLSEILKATGWFSEMQIEVNDSVVFINGTALTDEQKQWAGSLARNTEGVAAVVNRIAVKKDIDVANTMKVVAASVSKLWKDFLYRLPLIIAGILVLIITAVVNKVATLVGKRGLKRSHLRLSLQDLILQLMTIVIWLAGLLVAAIIVFPGMTPSKALTVLGLGSVAIGFAFKDIFENFFAGILILWKYPFDKGDFIHCGDIEGKIEDITIRMTMIRQVDGQLVVLPNAMLFKNAVDVLTSRPSRRTTVVCGVAYDTDLDDAQKTIRTAVNSCPSVSFDQPVEIFAQEFADSSINFEVTWWTGSTPLDIRESRDEVVRKVKQALDKAGIEIPFPQRTHWFPQALPLQQPDAGAN